MARFLPMRRLPIVGMAYSGMLIGAYSWWLLQSPRQRLSVLTASSTDIAHLEHVPWRVLPASSVWPGDLGAYWAVVALLCLGALELLRGPVVTLMTGVVAHVVGTLVSEGITAIRIAAGEISSSARNVLDVGPSYIVASCAAAVVASPRAPRLLRIACGVTLVPIVATAFDLDDASQVASIGHAVAMLIGALVARPWVRPDRDAGTPVADAGLAATDFVDTAAAVPQR